MSLSDVFHTMYAKDAEDARALYETMTTQQLVQLQAAHSADLDTAKTADAIAFGAGRLALIADVLWTRSGETSGSTVTRSAADLTTALRGWLRSRKEAPEAQAAAMTYEIVALVALHSESVAQACALVETWLKTMKEQIHELGVGVEHP